MNGARRTVRLLVALVGALAVVACTGDGGYGGYGPAATDHDADDVAFVRHMIPHHRQAIVMAAMAPTRADDPRVVALADRIARVQDEEVGTMAGWLADWDADSRGGHRGGMDGMGGMGGMGGPGGMRGMLTRGELDELSRTRGTAFDRLFLTRMIEHHEGAIAMTRREQAEGRHAGLVALAARMQPAQEAEIVQMRDLLAEPAS